MTQNSVFPLSNMIEEISAKHSTKTAIQMWGTDRISKSLTFGQMAESIREKAHLLKKIGVVPGERIGIIDSNSPEWVVAFFAIVSLGGTAVAIDTQLDGPDLIRFILDSDLRAVLTTREIFVKFESAASPELPSIFDLQNHYEILHKSSLNRTDNLDGDPSIALICFTSGSTGKPKGILLDHESLLMAREHAQIVGVKTEDRFLCVLPLTHVFGICTTLLAALSHGATVTFISEIKSEVILSALQGTKCTYFSIVPRLMEIFYNNIFGKINELPWMKRSIVKGLMSISGLARRYLHLNLGRIFFSKIHKIFGGELRRFPCGGAALRPEIWSGMSNLGFTITMGYGLTETAGVIAIVQSHEPREGRGLKPFHTMKVKVDPSGEICLKGKSVFRGYFRNPIASSEVLKDGWFHTGDLGYLTPHGEIVITGRCKELIVLPSGQKAIPNEVDRYYEKLEGVADFASFGVPVSPNSTSDLVHAAIVPDESFFQGSEEEIQKKIEKIVAIRGQSIPSHMRVSVVHILKAIPKTRVLKIKRNELREQFKKSGVKTSQTIENHQDSMRRVVENAVRTLLKLPPEAPLEEERGFFELGLDSLMATELVAKLEGIIGKPISSTAPFEYPNIVSMTTYLKEIVTGSSTSARESATSPKQEPIAIVGMSCRFPGSPDVASFWDSLEKGVDSTSELPDGRWNLHKNLLNEETKICKRGGFLNVPVDEFDASFFQIPSHHAKTLDPQQRLLLEVVWESLENGGIPSHSLSKTKTGVFIGASSHDYGDLLAIHSQPNHYKGHYGTGNASSLLAGRIAYFLALQGPCLTIDTACSSSLVALDAACKSLQLDESRAAIVGGVNLMLSPIPTLIFSQANMLSPDGRCKTFDQSANGYARGEGCGVVILKRLSDAIRDGDRIFATIESTKVNQDGGAGGLTVPNGQAQKALLGEALKQAGLEGAKIDYLETHGTGTSLGDPIEIHSSTSVLSTGRDPKYPLRIGSVKTNIGHLEAAAGIAGLIKVVLSLIHEKIPPHLHFQKLNPFISIDPSSTLIATKLEPWLKNPNRPRLAGVNSFGFSGTNAHAIVKEAPLVEKKSPSKEPTSHIVTISAKTEPALKALILAYQRMLQIGTDASLADIAYTSNTGRDHFVFRAAYAVKTKEELLQKLSIGECNPDQEFPLVKSYLSGDKIDWHLQYAPHSRQKVALPNYPFQRKRYWADALLEAEGVTDFASL